MGIRVVSRSQSKQKKMFEEEGSDKQYQILQGTVKLKCENVHWILG